MAKLYGCDISRPAATPAKPCSGLYFGYLGAVKEANGAAMSLGRISSFFDIYIERDLHEGMLTETGAQEFIGPDLSMKLRIVRFLRTPGIRRTVLRRSVLGHRMLGGMGEEGRPLVTKSAIRMLHTLYNLGPAPEPNLTVFWSPRLPGGFKRFAVKVSHRHQSSLQYETTTHAAALGDDCAIACCVSAMRLGKQMQFFGARVNLAKCLLYAINGGRDEMSAATRSGRARRCRRRAGLRRCDGQVRPHDGLAGAHLRPRDELHPLHARQVFLRAPRDGAPRSRHLRTMAFGIAGLSVAADSLAAIKYGKVNVIRDDDGLAVDYQIERRRVSEFGNNDDRVDASRRTGHDVHEQDPQISRPTAARPTRSSVLTITSNVVYGKATGNTPDGRRKGEPFAPGANPMHGRDSHGRLASCSRSRRSPTSDAADGICYTLSVVPQRRTGRERSSSMER